MIFYYRINCYFLDYKRCRYISYLILLIQVYIIAINSVIAIQSQKPIFPFIEQYDHEKPKILIIFQFCNRLQKYFI